MRIAIIGIGQAGGKILDKLLEYDVSTRGNFIKGCLAVNTARQDLKGLEHVPEEKQLLVGEADPDSKGSGVGADNDKGRKIMKREVGDVLGQIDDMPLYEIDAFITVAGLGGGTGSGGMPVVANQIKQTYGERVYGLGILPTKDEGSIYTLNAARSLNACVEHTDNLMLFDNNEWSRGKLSEKNGTKT
jgi:Cell division GTPase